MNLMLHVVPCCLLPAACCLLLVACCCRGCPSMCLQGPVLLTAAQRNFGDMVQLLIRAGADVNARDNSVGVGGGGKRLYGCVPVDVGHLCHMHHRAWTHQTR